MATERRLIDADMLKANFPVLGNSANDLWPSDVVRRAIDNASTVDAVEVVRCKDCKHCKHCTPDENIIGAYGDCDRFDRDNDNSVVSADDFCSYGERKECGT